MYHLGASIGARVVLRSRPTSGGRSNREPAAAEKAMALHMNELIRHIDDSMQALRDKANILNGEENGNGAPLPEEDPDEPPGPCG